MQIRFTLVSEGGSDRVLLPLIRWVLRQAAGQHTYEGRWPDLRKLRKPPRTLSQRLAAALHLEPCDLLFVHRDADCPDPDPRRNEIRQAVTNLAGLEIPPAICVVPIQMSEAWFLFDEASIRRAAGNPRGREPLQLPRLSDVEDRADAKTILQSALRAASATAGRRRRFLDTSRAYHRVAELIEDYSPLRQLSGFRSLEDDLHAVLQEKGWI